MGKPAPILFLSDARGVYIPRDFINEIRPECLTGIADDVADALRAGPDHGWYWEAWTQVESSAVVTDPSTGTRYSVYQNGDCWLIPHGMEWDDAAEFYAWPSDEVQS
jgi:hypothetical protein